MRNIYRLLILLAVFIVGIGAAVAWHTWPQVQFAQRGMIWSWHWGYFEPFANGIQQTRTQDTKQLLVDFGFSSEEIAKLIQSGAVVHDWKPKINESKL